MLFFGAFVWLVTFVNSDFESFILFVKGMFQAIIKEGFSSEFFFRAFEFSFVFSYVYMVAC